MNSYSVVFDDRDKQEQIRYRLIKSLESYDSHKPIFAHKINSGLADIMMGAVAGLQEETYEIENNGVVVISEVYNQRGPWCCAVHLLGFSQDNEVYNCWRGCLESMGFTGEITERFGRILEDVNSKIRIGFQKRRDS